VKNVHGPYEIAQAANSALAHRWVGPEPGEIDGLCEQASIMAVERLKNCLPSFGDLQANANLSDVEFAMKQAVYDLTLLIERTRDGISTPEQVVADATKVRDHLITQHGNLLLAELVHRRGIEKVQAAIPDRYLVEDEMEVPA
jgi:hypothetical protein